MQHIIGMPPQTIIIGIPLPIMAIMRWHISMNAALDMPSIGVISQTMPVAVILQVQFAIIMGIGIIMPPIDIPPIGMPFIGIPPIMGIIIGICMGICIIGIALFMIGGLSKQVLRKIGEPSRTSAHRLWRKECLNTKSPASLIYVRRELSSSGADERRKYWRLRKI
jgi:hypothetical protein